MRVFLPDSILKQGRKEVEDYIGEIRDTDNKAGRYVRDFLDTSFIETNIVTGLTNLKDLRGFYAIYNEAKYNKGKTDKLIYCQEVLGHSKDLKSLKTTLHYNRFTLV